MGLEGADTKALPCWVRKAVLTLPIAPAIAAPAAPGGTASKPIFVTLSVPVCVVLQFCANAAVEAEEAAIAKAMTAKTRPLRAFKVTFMKQPQNCKKRKFTAATVGQSRRPRK